MWLNYDDCYAVSDDGDVMNRKTGLILKQPLNSDGYPKICLYRKHKSVHQMIAQMFCPKIDIAGLVIDHINHDKTDNRASNLRWVNHTTNARNKIKEVTHIFKKPGYNCYTVRFKENYKVIYNKSFKTMEEAIIARDAFKERVN